MTEGTENGSGAAKRVVLAAAGYTALVMAVGLGLTLKFGADERPGAIIVYVFHSLFYSLCLGTLLALMFHASEEH
jgi:hypothetical protein